MPLLLASTVFVLSLLATFGTWRYASGQVDAAFRADFAFQVRQTTRRLEQRMATYAQVARGTQAFLLGALALPREDFRLFVASLQLPEKFPGIQGLALVEAFPAALLDAHVRRIRDEGFPEFAVRPAGQRDQYSAIIQIEPFTGLNLRALGYDMLTDAVRRAAMERARDTGQAAASGKVKLVQENGLRDQAGLVMYLPVYRRGTSHDTLAERRANLIGWVGAPFRMEDLMRGLGGERSDDIVLKIYDGELLDPDNLLYESAEKQSGHAPLLASRQRMDVAGRPWTLDLRSSSTYEGRIDLDKPRLIALVGLAISVLLAFLVWALASGRTRALTLATAMTHRLRESTIRVKSEQRRIRVILDNTHDAFVGLDRNGRISDWNAKAEQTFGWQASEALGKEFADLIIPAERRDAQRSELSRMSAGVPSPPFRRVVEIEGLHRSGRLIPLELAVAGVPEEPGIAVSMFIRDISERKEAARIDAARAQALEDAQEALQHSQRLEAVGKLTGGVAHDFNNVLQILSGNIQILERHHAHDEPLQRRLASMTRAVERGSTLSAHLLAFARRQPLRPVVLNLGDSVDEFDDSLRRVLGEAFELKLVVTDGLWNTQVDRNQLENVLLNLALNSRDAMPEGGELVIALTNAVLAETDAGSRPDTAPGDYVQIAVSDNGMGMAQETVERVFEPFFTTKRPGEGTGLGLSMAYGFVKQSGGHISIDSRIGQGTTVRIYLPRSTDLVTPACPEDIRPITGGHETILVAEDDPGVQGTVVTMLEELGYQVIAVDNGKAALDLLASGLRPDLLFTDVVMPGSVSSIELARNARRLWPGIAILFTSGYTHNALVRGGRLDDGVELLSKPYRREELALRIREVIANSRVRVASEPPAS